MIWYRARLLAVKLRCYEYNFACAQMKKELPKAFSDPKSNAWRLVPDDRDPLQRRRRQGRRGRPRVARNGPQGAPRHPLGPAGEARAERPLRLQMGRGHETPTAETRQQPGQQQEKRTKESDAAAHAPETLTHGPRSLRYTGRRMAEALGPRQTHSSRRSFDRRTAPPPDIHSGWSNLFDSLPDLHARDAASWNLR